MRFTLRELELRKVPFDVDLPVGEIDFQEQTIRQATPLHADGVAELLAGSLGEVRITGQVRVEMEADCDRCLDPVRVPFEASLDLSYRPAEETTGAVDTELEPDESEVGYYEGNVIELGDVLREQILLALPMHRICSENCQGICPQCGQNRNVGSCACETKPVDDRWSALRELKSTLRAGSV